MAGFLRRNNTADDENVESREDNAKERRSRARADDPVVDVRAQRRAYGGLNIGAAFFGWLVATGLGALLTAVLFAAGSGVALTSLSSVSDVTSNPSDASTVSIASAILLLVALAIAYYAGGYVAGRMSRFDGARQGAGVWLFGILITLLFAAAGAILGTKYNVLQQINLPHVPLDKESFMSGGLVTFIVILLATLLAAMSGGKVGQTYHRRVDRAGLAGA